MNSDDGPLSIVLQTTVESVVAEVEIFASIAITLYHTILTFNNPEKEAFRKHCGERTKCWLPAFSPFSAIFSSRPIMTQF